MEWTAAYWIRRRKRWTRRLGRDLRDLGPLAGVAFCVLSAATAIEAIERIPIPRTSAVASGMMMAEQPVRTPPPAPVASGPPAVFGEPRIGDVDEGPNAGSR